MNKVDNIRKGKQSNCTSHDCYLCFEEISNSQNCLKNKTASFVIKLQKAN